MLLVPKVHSPLNDNVEIIYKGYHNIDGIIINEDAIIN